MVTLTNRGQRAYGLPSRKRGDESVPLQDLKPGASAEVPDWYIDELVAEKGWRQRLENGEVSVRGAGASLPQQRGAEETLRAALGDARGEAVRQATRAEAAERRAKEAETAAERRVKELEAELAKVRAGSAPAGDAPPDSAARGRRS